MLTENLDIPHTFFILCMVVLACLTALLCLCVLLSLTLRCAGRQIEREKYIQAQRRMAQSSSNLVGAAVTQPKTIQLKGTHVSYQT